MKRKLSRLEWLFLLVPIGVGATWCVAVFAPAFWQSLFPRTLRGHVKTIGRLSFSRDGTTLMSIGKDVRSPPIGTHTDEIKLWNVADGQPLWSVSSNGSSPSLWESAYFSPNSRLLIATEWINDNPPQGQTSSELTHIYNARDGQEVQSIPVTRSAFEFFLDDKTLMSFGPTIRIRDLASKKMLRSFVSDYNYHVYPQIDWTKNFMVLLTDVDPQHFTRGCVLDLNTGHRVFFPATPWNSTTGSVPREFVISRNEKLVASAHRNLDHPTRLWDAKTGKLLHVLASRNARPIRFSPDSKTLACADQLDSSQNPAADFTKARICRLSLFDVSNGATRWSQISLLNCDSLFFSRDGRLIALEGSTNPANFDYQNFRSRMVVELRDAQNGALLTTIPGSNAVFSPDGKTLAVSDDKVIRLHDISGLAR